MISALKQSVREWLSRRLGVPRIPLALERLKNNGFQPAHIFDVGAYRGEFATECLRIWPSAHVTCFEVLPARADEIERINHPNIRLNRCLLGEKSAENVPFHELETASSVLNEHCQETPSTFYPMRTVDEFEPPDFLKLDVQGYEYQVLRGAIKSLPKIKAVLAEVNLLDIHRGVHLLDDLVIFLRRYDFVAYDICGLARRPLDQALWQADFVFVPVNSPLRSDKRWNQ